MPRLFHQSLCFATVIAAGVAFGQDPPQAPEPATPPPAPAADVEADVRADAQIDSPEAARPQTHRDDARDTARDAQSQGRTVQNEFEASDSARSSQQRAALGVTFGEGMIIRDVRPNTPAARMGLRPGDEIITLNGNTYDEAPLFVDAIGMADMNRDAEIVYLRNGEQHTATGRLGDWNMVYTETPYSGQRTAMRYPGPVNDGGYVDSGAGACCGYQTGSYGGYSYGGGHGYHHHSVCCDDHGGRRHWRRARRCCW